MRAHGVVKNASIYTAATVAQKIIALGFFWYVANALQPSALGRYTFALAFTALFSFITDLGLNPVLIREIARDPASLRRLLGGTLALKTMLAAACYAVILAAAWLTEADAGVRLLIALAAVVTALDAWTMSLWATLRGLQNLAYESSAAVLVQFTITVLGFGALAAGWGITGLMATLAMASLLHLGVATVAISRLLGFIPVPVVDLATIRRLLGLVPAFAVSGVFVRVYNNADVVLLGNLMGKTQVGFYAIPAKVTTALQQLIPVSISAALFPAFSASYRDDRERATQNFTSAFTFLLLAAVPIGVGLSLAAPWLIAAVWPRYTAVVPAFQLMVLTLPFLFLAYPTGYFLNACGGQRWNMGNRGVMTAVSIGANLALIPSYGFFGSAVAFLVANVVLLALDLHAVARFIHLPIVRMANDVAKVGAATLAMALLYAAFLPVLAGPLAAAVAALAYAAAAVGLGLIEPNQMRQLTRAIRS